MRPIDYVVVAFTVAAFSLLGYGALKFFRWYERSAQRALARLYEGLGASDSPGPEVVFIEYHTYHGLLVWTTQVDHRAFLPPKEARTLLWRLLRFTVSRGWTCLLVLPLALGNYYAQRRSIGRQIRSTPEGSRPSSER